MHESQLNGATKSYGVALGIACFLSALLVVAKELSTGIFNIMKTLTVHHWVTHGVFIMAIFLILGFVLSKRHNGRGIAVRDSAVLKIIVAGVTLGTAIIVLFYMMD